MGNEKYLNYYIETLTTTMTDCVIRNVSMQANAKVTDEVIKDQSEKIEELLNSNAELQRTIQELRNTNSANENTVIQELKNKCIESEKLVTKLNNELAELTTRYRDYDSIKNQSTHVETFKSELIKSREETNRVRAELETRINSLVAENKQKISEITDENKKIIEDLKKSHEEKVLQLSNKIDYLQLPPAKRKKIDELNKEIAPPIVIELSGKNSTVEDGGTF